MTQMQRLIGSFGSYKTGDWMNMARHIVAKHAYRLRKRSEPNNRIRYLGEQEIVYARTKSDQQAWRPADTAFVVEQLGKTETMVARLCTGLIDIGPLRGQD
jgi:hypothetical protein